MKPKKHNVGQVIVLAMCMLLMLVMAFVMFVGDSDYLLGKEARDVMDYANDGVAPPKGIHIKVNVDACLGNYAETQHKINGIIPAGKEEHYIVWLDNNAALSITVKNKKTINKLNSIIDDTWDYLDGVSDTHPSSITIEGQVSTMDSELEGYYDDYLEEMGFTDSGFPIYYVTVDNTDTRATGWLIIGVLLVIGIGCLIGMISTIKAIKREKAAAESVQNTYAGNNANVFGNINNYGADGAYNNSAYDNNAQYNNGAYDNNSSYNNGAYDNNSSYNNGAYDNNSSYNNGAYGNNSAYNNNPYANNQYGNNNNMTDGTNNPSDNNL